jgi:hypothetical protein
MQITRGHITQVRLVISEAYMVFYNDPGNPLRIDVPSGKLRTDKACDWWSDDADEYDALSITIHFDLSQSIVQTGPEDYKLKPVFHLFDDNLLEAATIWGYIDNDSFPANIVATVTFNGIDGDEAYTKVNIEEDSHSGDGLTEFKIFWLVPIEDPSLEGYTVEITRNGDPFYTEVSTELTDLAPGGIWLLKGGVEISIPE